MNKNKGIGSPSWHKARGRKSGEAGTPKSSKSGASRERNIGHAKGQEHSRVAKGQQQK